MIATIIVIISIIAIVVLFWHYKPYETKAFALKIYEFFKKHRYIRNGLLIFLVVMVFGQYLIQREGKNNIIKAVRIGYQESGPVLVFEAPHVEILDKIKVWAGNRKDSLDVVFKFNGVKRDSLVGGRFLTKTFGKLWPKSQKYAYTEGESKTTIFAGTQIKFNSPPYIVRIHTPKKGQPISFAKSVMRYKIIDDGSVKKAELVWEQQQSALLFQARRVELLESIVVEVNRKRSVVARKGDVVLLNGPPYKYTFAKKGEKATLIRGGRYKVAE